MPEGRVGGPPLRHLPGEGMNTPRAGASADRAGVSVLAGIVPAPFDPGGVKGCSHGWSERVFERTQPVEPVV